MEVGTVRWFNKEKGFGFIVPESGADVFVNHAAILVEDFLSEGDVVEYDLVKGPKGPQATNVRKVS